MNKWEKEVQQSLLDSEEAAIKELEKQYKQALKDINEKVKLFQADIDLLDQALSQDGLDDATKALLQSQKRSKIYQQQYQTALKGQVSGILDKMHSDNYTTIDKYLKDCYETGYIGTMYDISKQGIPIIAPIDQAAAVKAILTDSKVSNGLYNALGVNVGNLKKTITQEVSRGIASSLSYADIARNINNVSKTGLSNAERIARTEGHRIQQTSTRDAQQTAKANGADVVKQWDAALDGKTRDSHRRVDGEIRELDEKFSNGLMFPGDPAGGAAEVVNCRCACLTRARWALDEEELKTLQERAEFFGLDKTKNFDDFKDKYLTAAENVASQATTSTGASAIKKTGINKLDTEKVLSDHTIDDCYNTTNPLYSTGREYQVNCQRVVSTYEARRRGYDVVSAPAILTAPDTLPYMMHQKGWANVYKDGIANLEHLQGSRSSTIKKSIESKMAGYGDGARAIIRVQWQGGGGHVFIAEQINGATEFIDPQPGTRDCSYYFNAGMIKPSATRLLRIDDKDFTDLIEKCIIQN